MGDMARVRPFVRMVCCGRIVWPGKVRSMQIFGLSAMIVLPPVWKVCFPNGEPKEQALFQPETASQASKNTHQTAKLSHFCRQQRLCWGRLPATSVDVSVNEVFAGRFYAPLCAVTHGSTSACPQVFARLNLFISARRSPYRRPASAKTPISKIKGGNSHERKTFSDCFERLALGAGFFVVATGCGSKYRGDLDRRIVISAQFHRRGASRRAGPAGTSRTLKPTSKLTGKKAR